MKRREWLCAASAAAIGWATSPLLGASAQERKSRKRVLLFTRSADFEHAVVKRANGKLAHAEQVFSEMGRWRGFEVECTKDGRVFDGDLSPYDAIAFYTSGDLTRQANDGSPPMSPAGKKKLLEAIAAGKGFVGFHSASDTFHSAGPPDERPKQLDPYIAMLGGEFVGHGRPQEASLCIASRFPGAGDLGCSEGISFTEEWYALKNFADDLHVILVQETKYMRGDCYARPDFPCTWARMHGQGRVFYTSLGHREDIWTNPFFQTIVLGGVRWALGDVAAKVEPNLKRVAPHADQLPAGKNKA